MGWGEENAGLICGIKTELHQTLLDWNAGKPVEKITRCGLIFRGLQDHTTLTDFRVAASGETDEAAEFAEVGGAGEGKRDQADLGVAGLGKLCRLCDVFGDYKLVGDCCGEMQALKGFGRGKAVGCVQTVGDGDLRHFGTGKDVKCEGLRD